MKAVKALPGQADPTSAELRQAGRMLASRLRREIRVYEVRYEIPSDRLEDALVRGEIRETAEVANWVIAYRMLRNLADERQTRPE